MARFLITGGAGFIGSSLAEAIAANEGDEVWLLDNLLTGRRENVPDSPRVRFVEGDVNVYDELASLMNEVRFDHVFHYAAVVGVKRTLANPVAVLDDIEGIKNVLRLCRETGVKRVYFSSSSEVYGESIEFPQHEETTPLNSRLPYAIVKNVGEAFFRVHQQEYGLDYTIFRFFNTYGPRQSPDFVVAKFFRAALAGADLTVYGDGGQSRTFCHIDDNVEATLRIVREGLHVNDVLNFGNDTETSVLELAESIVRVTGSKSKIVHAPPLAEGDMQRRLPDNSKMRALLAREPIPIEEGLRRIAAGLGASKK